MSHTPACRRVRVNVSIRREAEEMRLSQSRSKKQGVERRRHTKRGGSRMDEVVFACSEQGRAVAFSGPQFNVRLSAVILSKTVLDNGGPSTAQSSFKTWEAPVRKVSEEHVFDSGTAKLFDTMEQLVQLGEWQLLEAQILHGRNGRQWQLWRAQAGRLECLPFPLSRHCHVRCVRRGLTNAKP